MLSFALQALLCNLNWFFTIESEVFERQILCGKMVKWKGAWYSKEVSGDYGIALWTTMRKLWEVVNCRISFFMGNGIRVKF